MPYTCRAGPDNQIDTEQNGKQCEGKISEQVVVPALYTSEKSILLQMVHSLGMHRAKDSPRR